MHIGANLEHSLGRFVLCSSLAHSFQSNFIVTCWISKFGWHRCWWPMLASKCLGHGYGHFGHQHPLSFYIIIEHQHPQISTNFKSSTSPVFTVNSYNIDVCDRCWSRNVLVAAMAISATNIVLHQPSSTRNWVTNIHKYSPTLSHQRHYHPYLR